MARLFVAKSVRTTVATLLGQTKHNDQNNQAPDEDNRSQARNPQDYEVTIGHCDRKQKYKVREEITKHVEKET